MYWTIGSAFMSASSHTRLISQQEKAPRGLGLKIFGVDGEMMEGSEGSTQDLFFNNAPMLEVSYETAVTDASLRI